MRVRRRRSLQRHRLAVLLRSLRPGTIRRLLSRILTPPSFATMPLGARPHKELLARNATAPQVADHQQKRPTRIGKGAVHYSSDFRVPETSPKCKKTQFPGGLDLIWATLLPRHSRAVPSGLRGFTSVFDPSRYSHPKPSTYGSRLLRKLSIWKRSIQGDRMQMIRISWFSCRARLRFFFVLGLCAAAAQECGLVSDSFGVLPTDGRAEDVLDP
jgi:hypothetical protein